MNEQIAIVGAGIAGLTCASVLSEAGKSVRIFESAEEIRPVGLGIWLGINAMQVLGKMGLADKIISKGHCLGQMVLFDNRGRLLKKISISDIAKQFGYPLICLLRSELQEVLLNSISVEILITGKRLSKLDQCDSNIKLWFDDSSSYESNYVIGTDGIQSQCRKSLFPEFDLKHNSKFCIRGISSLKMPAELQNSGVEYWGDGSLFGFAQIGPSSFFWWAICGAPVINEISANVDELLDQTFRFFPGVVKNLIANRNRNRIHQGYLDDNISKLKHWHQGRVCLLGDAAHCMHPNFGQGGSMAIENAYFLAKRIISSEDIADAFYDLEHRCKPKTDLVIDMSSILKLASESTNPLINFARRWVMKATPDYFSKAVLKKVYKATMP